MLDAKVETRFVLISERNMVIHCGAQFDEDTHEQQIYCNNMQPRFIHAFFAASVVPVTLKFCRNQLPFNYRRAGARGWFLKAWVIHGRNNS